ALLPRHHPSSPKPDAPGTPAPLSLLFLFSRTPPSTEIHTLSLHDALPISARCTPCRVHGPGCRLDRQSQLRRAGRRRTGRGSAGDRKSTRLNSSHVKISYAVFCLKKKNGTPAPAQDHYRRIPHDTPARVAK